jgi:hypothetical protein
MNPDLARVLALYFAGLIAVLILFHCLAEDAALPRAAKRRARTLFLAKLDRKQRWSWFFLRRFDVVGASGRSYSIFSYQAFNVRSGEREYCLQVQGRVPVYDKLLAQKLLIEADEQHFLTLANARVAFR